MPIMKKEQALRDYVREVVSEARAPRPAVGPGSRVPASVLGKGMRVEASYRSTNVGSDRVEILGVANDAKYGEEGVKFETVRQAMKAAGVTSLRALEAQGDYYLVVRELPYGDQGPWYYLFQGRWCRGSGAEPLTFVLI